MADKDKTLRGNMEGLFSDLPAATPVELAPGAPPVQTSHTSGGEPAGEELRLAYPQLMNIIEFLPDATFVIDQDKKVIAWNRAIEEMTSTRKEDMLEQGDYAYAVPFYGERRPILIDLVGMENAELEAKYDFVKRQGHTLYAEVFVPSVFGGQGGHLRATASALLDSQGNPVGAIESIRDLTECKQAKDALRQNQIALQETAAQLRTLFENAPEAIVLLDADTGKFIDLNENAVRLYGLGREELLKVGPADMSPPTQPDGRPSFEAAMEIMQESLKGSTPVVEWMHRNAAGRDILCEVRLVRMPAAGRNLVRASITDISQRKQTEVERERLVQDVQARAQRDQLINAMVARVRSSLTVDQVLAATVEEIGTALGAARVAVRLKPIGGDPQGAFGSEEGDGRR
jgi:PAS domain S-box-containing protein